MKDLSKEQQQRVNREILTRMLILDKQKKEKEELQKEFRQAQEEMTSIDDLNPKGKIAYNLLKEITDKVKRDEIREIQEVLKARVEALEHRNNRLNNERMKMTPYHEEQNRREAEANKKMPKISIEEFKKQVQKLKDQRKAQGN